ncbi:MAG: GspH/FimT family protein [Betaproteobacteria bacterium]|nr:GspH/FimT family protein [Betaproteobacteria bacterium]
MRRGVCERRPAGAGFSLPELVVVIAVASIVSAVALPRLSRAPYDTLGYAQRLAAGLQFARKAAVAQRRNVCVVVASNDVTLSRATGFGAACSAPLPDPSTGQAFALATPGGVALSASLASFSFDALGRASGTSTITVSGDAIRTIIVEAETGLIH